MIRLRLSGSLESRNSRTRAGGGKVPVRSRQTRRRNSASLESSEGTMLNFFSLAKTCRSMKLFSGTWG